MDRSTQSLTSVIEQFLNGTSAHNRLFSAMLTSVNDGEVGGAVSVGECHS